MMTHSRDAEAVAIGMEALPMIDRQACERFLSDINIALKIVAIANGGNDNARGIARQQRDGEGCGECL